MSPPQVGRLSLVLDKAVDPESFSSFSLGQRFDGATLHDFRGRSTAMNADAGGAKLSKKTTRPFRRALDPFDDKLLSLPGADPSMPVPGQGECDEGPSANGGAVALGTGLGLSCSVLEASSTSEQDMPL